MPSISGCRFSSQPLKQASNGLEVSLPSTDRTGCTSSWDFFGIDIAATADPVLGMALCASPRPHPWLPGFGRTDVAAWLLVILQIIGTDVAMTHYEWA
jgi:hypothetical protein